MITIIVKLYYTMDLLNAICDMTTEPKTKDKKAFSYNSELFIDLLNKYDNIDNKYLNKCLYFACIYGDYNAMRAIIDKGADVDFRYPDGTSPLLIICTLSYGIEYIHLLMLYGANVNCEDYEGFTPLFKAIECGNYNIVEYLIQNGANVNKINDFNQTILVCACKSYMFTSNEKIIYLIINLESFNIKTLYSCISIFHETAIKYLESYNKKTLIEIIKCRIV